MTKTLQWITTALLPAAALVVLIQSARGAFRSAATFPLIFAAVVIAAGLVSLFLGRRRGDRRQTVLVVLAMVLAGAAPVAHDAHLERARRAAEAAGMEALGSGLAPAIGYTWAVNPDPGTGNPVDFDGRWTVVNFWATWCGPCREEMPALEGFWREHRSAGLRVVGVTRLWGGEEEAAVERERGEIEAFVEAAGVSYPIVVSDAATVDAYRVRSWPTSVLVGPDSRAVAYGVGIDGAEELLARARELVEAPAPAPADPAAEGSAPRPRSTAASMP